MNLGCLRWRKMPKKGMWRRGGEGVLTWRHEWRRGMQRWRLQLGFLPFLFSAENN
ncbi:hypothetical protein ES288_A07G242800v1 [Gossypium darwinii]|uniref:Uncharacterized protein n=1 Tax=Gossypium darwinii TaxID=34276 RepID=A0A5D2G0H0_GOSDA|nr:hypothetical protein ES288_A07G242800v1 [Gossypium darwinii]